MSFKQTFEENLNDDMQGNERQGRATAELEDVDMDIKKSALSPPEEEFNDSKERPPRFSTLYGVAPKASPKATPQPPQPPPATAPAQQYDYHREYYGPPSRSRKSAVTIPMPLFIILSIIFAFESTVLFAYTIIGLYNNAPSRLFPWAGPGTTTAVCNPVDHQPSINFAPNFMMPQAGKALSDANPETVTVSATPSTITISATASTTTVSATPSTTTVSATATSSTSTSTSATSTANGSAVAADLISGLLGSLAASKTSATPSVALVTVGPKPSTVTSVQLVTKDPAGNIISGSMVTSTSILVVPASSSTGSITSRSEGPAPAAITPTSVITGWTAISSALEDADSTAKVTG